MPTNANPETSRLRRVANDSGGVFTPPRQTVDGAVELLAIYSTAMAARATAEAYPMRTAYSLVLDLWLR